MIQSHKRKKRREGETGGGREEGDREKRRRKQKSLKLRQKSIATNTQVPIGEYFKNKLNR